MSSKLLPDRVQQIMAALMAEPCLLEEHGACVMQRVFIFLQVYDAYSHAFDTLHSMPPVQTMEQNAEFTVLLKRLVDDHGEQALHRPQSGNRTRLARNLR